MRLPDCVYVCVRKKPSSPSLFSLLGLTSCGALWSLVVGKAGEDGGRVPPGSSKEVCGRADGCKKGNSYSWNSRGKKAFLVFTSAKVILDYFFF